MQESITSNTESISERESASDTQRKRTEYHKQYWESHREQILQRQREYRRAKKVGAGAQLKPEVKKTTQSGYKSLETAQIGLGRAIRARKAELSVDRMIKSNAEKPKVEVDCRYAKKIGAKKEIMGLSILSEVNYGLVPCKKGTDIKNAVEYFRDVVYTDDDLEVFAQRVRKLVTELNLRDAGNPYKVVTDRVDGKIATIAVVDDMHRIMGIRFRTIKGNYERENF